jgi:glycosyltransferase involved in cell wall biosynthesis
VGDGPGRKAAESKAQRLGLGSTVEFLGDRWDVAEILAESSVFALASKWEGFPISILEAMRAGLPVLATSTGGVKEAVRHGGTGLLVPPGDLGQFREALGVLLASRELRERYGMAGRLLFEQHFRVEAMLSKTFDVYEDVLRDGLTGVPGEAREAVNSEARA